ncbi:MAG TPA: undecaprenyl-phosphate glucose phosphotransferase [Candidatus Binatia bacterium]|jgi:Undecaprenyl-phosphate glucose phosphotransferase|nr:undecaprenyl-phosphate glucose phosphotransferase [Candidatus Binatia bacterium]
MLKQYSQFFKGLMCLHDLFFVSLAWWLAYLVRFHTDLLTEPEPYVFRHYVAAWLLIVVSWGVVFQLLDLYRPRRISTYWVEAADIAKGSLVALLIFLGVIFLLRDIVVSRFVVIFFFILSVILLQLSHIIFREALRLLRRRGYNLRHTLVIGSAAQAKDLIEKLQWHRHLGLRIVGAYLTDASPAGEALADVKLLKEPAEAMELVRSGADQVFVTLPFGEVGRLREIREWLGDEPITLYFVPDLAEFVSLRGRIEEFEGLPIISLQDSPLYGWNSVIKRVVDLFLGSAALIFFCPLMGLIAIGIKLTSAGPILYRQERTGLDGRRFQMLKFRTMGEAAEKISGPVWATPDDPRVTALGRWLRRASLDELPQLINVIKGEMSLVGPRPERPPFVEQFRETLPKYLLRHKVKAGMTGWAQVHGWRGQTPLEKRLEYDLYYIENWSFWLDLKILARTLLRGFLHRNAY